MCGSSGRVRHGHLRWWWPREAQLSPVAATVVRGVTVSSGGGHVRRGWLRQQRRPNEARVARVGGLHGGEDWLRGAVTTRGAASFGGRATSGDDLYRSSVSRASSGDDLL